MNPAPVEPAPVEVEAGKTYWWCRCGLSARQPFCDGAHKGGDFSPLKFTAERTGRLWFCVCKKTATAPLCDAPRPPFCSVAVTDAV